MPFLLLLIVAGAFAATTPAQNDTWWHLRSGHEMFETRSFLVEEPFSHTSAGSELQNHWWLSQLLFFSVFAAGGAPLLTAVAGGSAALAIFGSWRLTRGSSPDLRLLLLAFLIVATAPGWAIRPQVISLLFMVLVMHLVKSGRTVLLPAVCVVWANAHALVIFGVLMAGAVAAEAMIWSKGRFRREAVTAGLCVLSPMCSPIGWNYWPQILRTVSTSKALDLQEYRAPVELMDFPFWVMLAALVAVAVVRRSSLGAIDRAHRIYLIAAAGLALAGISAARNIAFFAVVAAPALAGLLPARARATTRAVRPAPWPAYALLALALGGSVSFVAMRWRNGGVQLGWQPIAPAALAAVRQCEGPLYNQMEDGGYLMWTLRDRAIFVDSRMEAYPLEFLQRVRRSEHEGEYDGLFREHDVSCAIVMSGSPLHERLLADPRMRAIYVDSRRAVFARLSVASS